MNAPDLDERYRTPIDRHLYAPLAGVIARGVETAGLGPRSVLGTAAVLGLSGASLLRYTSARLLVPGALLLLGYGTLDATAAAIDEGDPDETERLRRLAHVVVGLASGVGVALHFAAQPDGPSGALAMAAAALVLAQGWIVDLVRGGAPSRVFPELPDDKLAELDLGLLPRVWAWLSESTHVVLFAIFICADALEAYAWLRIVGGSLLAFGILFEQRRRRMALVPAPKPPEADEAKAGPSLASRPPGPAATPEADRTAPISFRPPPDD